MSQAPVNVLLVDADITYAKLTQQHLTTFMGRRFNLLWKQAGNAALEELERNKKVDIVLTESHLPDMSGLELTRGIREKNIAVPIIFLTSEKDFRLAIEAMKTGAEEYLIKKETTDTILPRTILNILDRVELKRKIAEAEHNRVIAERRTEAIRELIVAISHEFNNPLTAMKLTADAIARQQLPEQQQLLVSEISEMINLIEGKIRKLQNLEESR